MKRISLYLSEKQIKILRGMNKSTGLSMAEHIRRAIDEYIKNMVKEYDNRTKK